MKERVSHNAESQPVFTETDGKFAAQHRAVCFTLHIRKTRLLFYQ